MTGVRALTLWQPWATMIARGLKRWELRTWAPPLSRAAQSSPSPRRAAAHPRGQAAHRVAVEPLPPRNPEACAVEDVLVVAKPPRRACGPCLARDAYTGETTWCGTDLWGVWEPGTVVWRLCEVGPVPPAPCAGRQGLWRPSAETLRAVARGLDR